MVGVVIRGQIFPELRGVQEARDIVDVGELVEGVVELLRLSELLLGDLQLRGERLNLLLHLSQLLELAREDARVEHS